MKEVLALIEEKKKEFAQLPLFEFMQDKSIDPRQRLSFVPCLSPFIMSFRELNKSVMREEQSTSLIQAIINKHTHEEDHHWMWFLEDLEKLGFDRYLRFSEALKFLWSEQTNISRRLGYELYRYSIQASSIEKMIILEVEEATSSVFFSVSSQVALELKSITKKEYNYFGNNHLAAETAHSYCSSDVQQFLESIQTREEERKKYFELVEKLFEVFTELVNDLLVSARITSAIKTETKVKPLGAYLLEAGLLTQDQLKIALDKQKETPMRLGEVLSNQGWVNQKTIEYVIDNVVAPQREASNLTYR